jgi:hypothetical protein
MGEYSTLPGFIGFEHQAPRKGSRERCSRCGSDDSVAVGPTERWNRLTAVTVAGPYCPSIFPVEKPKLASARCSTLTCALMSPATRTGV